MTTVTEVKKTSFVWTSRATTWTVSIAVALVLVALLWAPVAAQPISLVTAVLNGVTAASLYFLVAAGFTLIFGLMRVTNLAHGSLYLIGGYIGYTVASTTGNWFLGVIGGALGAAIAGFALHQGLLRWVQGDDLRESLVTIGVLTIVADQCLALWGSNAVSFDVPEFLNFVIPFDGGYVYPFYRVFILLMALAIGALLWLLFSKTKFGLSVRAGVDDKDMVSALGINVQILFIAVFAIGALLAGFAGVIGGSYLSIAPGEDGRYLLLSLVVVIVGGLGSIPGAALGALLIGLVEAFAQIYAPTFSVLFSFGVMVLVLAVRPRGLLGRAL